ncbi:MAG: hypothetical protein KAI66_00340 [Lentisphaeria bacterium]|nr:hypothetical protein [Lentisphaeria bacterium]
MITRKEDRVRGGRRYQTLKSSTTQSGTVFQRLLIVLGLFLMLAVGGVFEYARNTGERDRLAVERAGLERRVKLQEEKLTNARIVLESYKSGKYIFRRIREWDLDLHKPTRTQVTGVLPDGRRAPMPAWVRESIVARSR